LREIAIIRSKSISGVGRITTRLRVRAVDLHAGLDVARACMDDYAAKVLAAAAGLPGRFASAVGASVASS
jgi:hypothetical protein